MKNNKGFTLVEILAAVTILGILSAMAIGAYYRYMDQAKNQAYKVMAKSATTAAEDFIMDNPGAAVETIAKMVNGKTLYEIKNMEEQPGISFKTLIEEGYLDSAKDPNTRGSSCTGKVTIGLVTELDAFGKHKDGVLDQYIYVVDECCSNYKARYTYTYEKDGSEKKAVEMVDRNSVVCP